VDVPAYGTPELECEWLGALSKLTNLGELEIPCAMSVPSRRIIFQVIRAMGAKTVLDIGTFTGTSALTCALAVGNEGRVVTVDIRDANHKRGHWKMAGRPRNPQSLMEEAGVDERVEFVTRDSVEYLQDTRETFDFIILDGWHEDFAVHDEIELSLQRLNKDGLIFLDDVQPLGYEPPTGFDRIDGPRIAIERHLAKDAPLRFVPLTPIPCGFLVRAT
jgi:predicted O-methyltransferase YrrM